MSNRLVLLRHGQSTWNLENKFTGWHDVDLSAKGVGEARRAGELLKAEGIHFDVAFTSVLKRAIRTLWISLDVTDQMWLPVHRTWKLNERHYGALTGLDKVASVAEHGEEQVKKWRRGYAIQPPELDRTDPRHPCHDRRYANLPADLVPGTESLADTRVRVMEIWDDTIAPRLAAGENVLIAAHGNSLRALLMHLQGLNEDEIAGVNVPTGFPLLFEMAGANPIGVHRYLGNASEIEAAIHGVANQTKKG